MLLSRLFLPLLFICSLLLAQQGGIAHTLSHTLAGQTQQEDKQSPHSLHCELCALDAQLGSALNSPAIIFALALLPAVIWAQHSTSFKPAHSVTATARGPPAPLQVFA